jgi:hypothetical protein
MLDFLLAADSLRRARAMTVKGPTVQAMNHAYARLSLTPARTEELPIELNQLRGAIESVNHRVDFDLDPFDFRVALLATAAGAKP